MIDTFPAFIRSLIRENSVLDTLSTSSPNISQIEILMRSKNNLGVSELLHRKLMSIGEFGGKIPSAGEKVNISKVDLSSGSTILNWT